MVHEGGPSCQSAWVTQVCAVCAGVRLSARLVRVCWNGAWCAEGGGWWDAQG